MTRPSADRVKVEWTGTGTGTLTLGSPVSGFQGFPSALDGQVVSYSIEHQTSTEVEAGYGTYTSGTNTLSRSYRTYPTLGGAAVNFSPGTKHVRLTAIAADIAPNLATADPAITDDFASGYRMGNFWINTTANTAFICTDPANGAAVWVEVAGGGGVGDSFARRLDLSLGPQTYTLDAAHKGQRIVFHGTGNSATVVVPNSIVGTDQGGGVWDSPYWWIHCDSDVTNTLTLDVATGATVDLGASAISNTTEALNTNSNYLIVWNTNVGGTAATYSLYQMPAADALGALAAKSAVVWTTDVSTATANKFAGWDGSGNPVLRDATGDAAPSRVTVTSATSPYTLTDADREHNSVEIFCSDGANNLIVVLPAGKSLGSWLIKRGASHTGDVLVRGETSAVSIDGIAGPTNGINLPAANTSGVVTMDALDVARWEGPSTQVTISYGHHDFNSNQAQNAVLQTATLGNELSCADQLVTRPELKDYAETRTAPTISGNTLTLDMQNGNCFEVTLNSDVTTLTLSNPPATGKVGTIFLVLKQDGTGGRSFTWPAAVKWAGGTPPTVSTAINAKDIYTLVTMDAGTIWHGFIGGQAFL